MDTNCSYSSVIIEQLIITTLYKFQSFQITFVSYYNLMKEDTIEIVK